MKITCKCCNKENEFDESKMEPGEITSLHCICGTWLLCFATFVTSEVIELRGTLQVAKERMYEIWGYIDGKHVKADGKLYSYDDGIAFINSDLYSSFELYLKPVENAG